GRCWLAGQPEALADKRNRTFEACRIDAAIASLEYIRCRNTAVQRELKALKLDVPLQKRLCLRNHFYRHLGIVDHILHAFDGGAQETPHRVRMLLQEHAGDRDAVAVHVEAVVLVHERADVFVFHTAAVQVDDGPEVLAGNGVDLALDQQGLSQSRVEILNLYLAEIEIIQLRKNRQRLVGGIVCDRSERLAFDVLYRLNSARLEKEQPRWVLLVSDHNFRKRHIRILGVKFH